MPVCECQCQTERAKDTERMREDPGKTGRAQRPARAAYSARATQ